MKKKVALHNLGCKVNAYELEAMRQMLLEGGYEIVPFEASADIYIINTCTVTNIADRKSRQMLHKARAKNPKGIVVATGCYVQASAKRLEADEAVDIIIGNNKKQELLSILADYFEETGKVQVVADINETDEYEALSISDSGEHTRAYIKVQDGCNQFCTYCIIPYMRGRVRSRDISEVKAEVERLAKAGYQEVVLTGIHLSSYAVETGEKDGLLKLIQAVHEVWGIERIRLGSLEPRIITEEFVSAIVKLEKVCPHFHLSLQSGCDAILKRMNRRYSTKEYEEKCEILKKFYGQVALTTDIIVGFPGETEEEFAETKNFVQTIGFYETHIFKYSPRQGTKAATMPAQVEETFKSNRSKELIALGREQRQTFMKRFLGQELSVLIEDKITIEETDYLLGHTKEYLQVIIKLEDDLVNKIITVKAKDILASEYILGEFLK